MFGQKRVTITLKRTLSHPKALQTLKKNIAQMRIQRTRGNNSNQKESPELCRKQVPFLRVNHLRTEDASEPLLRGVKRAGEGLMVSPAHPGCLRGTSEGG